MGLHHRLTSSALLSEEQVLPNLISQNFWTRYMVFYQVIHAGEIYLINTCPVILPVLPAVTDAVCVNVTGDVHKRSFNHYIAYNLINLL